MVTQVEELTGFYTGERSGKCFQETAHQTLFNSLVLFSATGAEEQVSLHSFNDIGRLMEKRKQKSIARD